MWSQCPKQLLGLDLPLQGTIWRFVASPDVLSDFQTFPPRRRRFVERGGEESSVDGFAVFEKKR
jgi:hypothetical protein